MQDTIANKDDNEEEEELGNGRVKEEEKKWKRTDKNRHKHTK